MFIKKPGYGRATYALVDDNNKTVQDERIKVINKDLKRGVARDELDARMKLILDSFKPSIFALAPSNLRLAREYDKRIRKIKPNLRDHRSLYNRVVRSVEALGKVTVRDATEDQLLEAIAHVTDTGRRYHIIGGLNTLLRLCGRDLRIRNQSPTVGNEVVYLHTADFLEKLKTIENPMYRDLLATYFATGCRWGELPAAVIQGNTAHINAQLDKDGMTIVTKNKKGRRAPIIPTLREYVLRYNALSDVEKRELRLYHHFKVYKLAKRQLGVRIHDLRHSYAVAWAKQGTSVAKIALWIGNTEYVCYKHYSRYQPADEELEREVAAWKV